MQFQGNESKNADKGQGAGDRGLVAGGRGQGIGCRGQEAGDRGQGAGDRGQGTGNRGQRTGDKGQGTGDRRQALPALAAHLPTAFTLRRNHATGTAQFVKISRVAAALFPTERKMASQATSTPCKGIRRGGVGL